MRPSWRCPLSLSSSVKRACGYGPRDCMRKVAALAGTLGPALFGGVLVVLTLIEYDFMRSLGWEPLGVSNTDWPSGLALGPYGYVMTGAFLINGLFMELFAIGLLRALPATRTSRAAAILLLLRSEEH